MTPWAVGGLIISGGTILKLEVTGFLSKDTGMKRGQAFSPELESKFLAQIQIFCKIEFEIKKKQVKITSLETRLEIHPSCENGQNSVATIETGTTLPKLMSVE